MTSPLALQIRLTLTGVAPPIWRRLLIPSHIHLGKLHDIIQCAMGWTDSHLHEFGIGGRRYGLPMPEYDEPGNRVFQERKAKLGDLAGRVGDQFTYTYDFGDNWQHEIVVEEILPGDSERPTAECIAGERSCPPEDIGGVYGYAGFLEAIADPSHEDHERYLEWIGGDFDPEEFDAEKVNIYLKNLTGRWRAPRGRR